MLKIVLHDKFDYIIQQNVLTNRGILLGLSDAQLNPFVNLGLKVQMDSRGTYSTKA